MKLFHCSSCDQLVYFENTQCVNCGSVLAYLSEQGEVRALQAAGDGAWTVVGGGGEIRRLCSNYTDHNVCNWTVPADSLDGFCIACQLNNVIPNLGKPENREAWAKMELAKRRLLHSLLTLRLPVLGKSADPVGGLAFELLEDDPTPGAEPVLTGHDEGLIVLNIAEADDAEREKRRVSLHEPYRTILGHFRHEVGHYYWDRLIRDTEWLPKFRAVFGDETFSYDEALKIHYEKGAPPDWRESFISSYATMHPWEDWAETWAHYLHMYDTLETAAACGVSLAPVRPNEPSLPSVGSATEGNFDAMIASWFPLTHMLNNLNRGLGLADGYPFLLPTPVIEKLRFIHEVIAWSASRVPAPAAQEIT